MLSLPELAEILWQLNGIVSVELEGESPARLRVECVSNADRERLRDVLLLLWDSEVNCKGLCTLIVRDDREG